MGHWRDAIASDSLACLKRHKTSPLWATCCENNQSPSIQGLLKQAMNGGWVEELSLCAIELGRWELLTTGLSQGDAVALDWGLVGSSKLYPKCYRNHCFYCNLIYIFLNKCFFIFLYGHREIHFFVFNNFHELCCFAGKWDCAAPHNAFPKVTTQFYYNFIYVPVLHLKKAS